MTDIIVVQQEEEGVLKSGNVIAGFAPIKSKKTFYCVLTGGVVELHESEKTQLKRKPPKIMIDLATCFNVNRQIDTKLKYCVSVMTPAETIVLRGDTDEQTEDWYDVIFAAAITARALSLGRPVLPTEFFECAWDVTLVKTAKLRRPVISPDTLVNLCTRDPKLCGDRRLCFYPHTIVICMRGIEPAKSGMPKSCIPPFEIDHFIEFQRTLVPSFGHQEKYFFMRMGRSAPTGCGELWMQTESDEVAADIYSKLNKIIDREREKKRQLGNGPLVHSVPSRHTTSHRDRSNTQPQHQRTASIDNTGDDQQISHSARDWREKRSILRDCKAFVDSFEEENDRCNYAIGSSMSMFGNIDQQQQHLTPNRQSPVSSLLAKERKASSGSTSSSPLLWTPTQPIRSNSVGGVCLPISNLAQKYHQPPPTRAIEEEVFGDYTAMQPESSISAIGDDENDENSGGTLHNQPTGDNYMPMKSSESKCHPPQEDYTQMDRGGATDDTDDDTRLIDGAEYTPMDVASCSSGSASHLAVPSTYEQMNWNLEEVRSYVSDSSDSCYSSMTAGGGGCAGGAGAPRAYSFGSRPPARATILRTRIGAGGGGNRLDGQISPMSTAATSSAAHSGDDELFSLSHHYYRHQPTSHHQQMQTQPHQQQLVLPSQHHAIHALPPTNVDDPRKRALSLGSKSWFPFGKPFKKFSQATRNRHIDPSTESVDSHTRSGSFGSGKSMPYTTRKDNHHPSNRSSTHAPTLPHSSSRDMDLVELDFGGIAIGRSPSGSLASGESPVRSRTSSFGGSQGHMRMGTLDDSSSAPPATGIYTTTALVQPTRAITSPGYDRPSDKLILDFLRQSATTTTIIDEVTPPSTLDSTDYVLSEANDSSTAMRTSACFETIVETMSPKSSRSSSSCSQTILADRLAIIAANTNTTDSTLNYACLQLDQTQSPSSTATTTVNSTTSLKTVDTDYMQVKPVRTMTS